MKHKISYLNVILYSLILIIVNYTGNSNLLPVYLDLMILVFIYSVIIYNKTRFDFILLKESTCLLRRNKKFISLFLLATTVLFLINISLSSFSLLIFGEEVVKYKPQYNFFSLSTIIILIPIIEEYFFRVFLAKGIYNSYGFNKGVIISTLSFTITHLFSGSSLLMIFFGGLVFGYIYLKTNSYLLSLLVHSISNLLTYVFIFGIISKMTLISSNSMFYIVIVSISTSIILLLLLVRKTKSLKS